CSSTRDCAAPISDLVFCRKNPVVTINCSTRLGFAVAIERASGNSANSAGVARLTPASVACADRIVAARHCQGVSKFRLIRALGYSFASAAEILAARFIVAARDSLIAISGRYATTSLLAFETRKLLLRAARIPSEFRRHDLRNRRSRAVCFDRIAPGERGSPNQKIVKRMRHLIADRMDDFGADRGTSA